MVIEELGEGDMKIMSFGAILAVGVLIGLSQPVWATGYALIVGASKYTSLDERMQLEGPKYDAEMVSAYLKQKKTSLFPVANVKVLADGVAGAHSPTKAAIEEAMASIAQKVSVGDFVYLHFSGHGSRQPAKVGDLTETDGLDEMFLPSDIGAWDDTVGAVKNALIDDEIGTLIGGIRNKGAFVWVVFDSCHSGTVTRGAPAGEEMRMRQVEPRLQKDLFPALKRVEERIMRNDVHLKLVSGRKVYLCRSVLNHFTGG